MKSEQAKPSWLSRQWWMGVQGILTMVAAFATIAGIIVAINLADSNNAAPDGAQPPPVSSQLAPIPDNSVESNDTVTPGSTEMYLANIDDEDFVDEPSRANKVLPRSAESTIH